DGDADEGRDDRFRGGLDVRWTGDGAALVNRLAILKDDDGSETRKSGGVALDLREIRRLRGCGRSETGEKRKGEDRQESENHEGQSGHTCSGRNGGGENSAAGLRDCGAMFQLRAICVAVRCPCYRGPCAPCSRGWRESRRRRRIL